MPSSSAAENFAAPIPPKRRKRNSAAAHVLDSSEDAAGETQGQDDAARDPAWKKFVRRVTRQAPRPLHELLEPHATDIPLLWGLPDSSNFDATRAIVRKLHKATRQGIREEQAERLKQLADEWLVQEPLADDRPKWLLEALAWAHAAPLLAGRFAPPHWQALVERLVSIAREVPQPHVNDDPWTHQLLAELCATLAYQLPELPESAGLAELARDSLSHGLCELTDGEGLLHTRFFALLRPLLACWTRCALMMHESKRLSLAKEAEFQLELLVEQAIRWTRRDGSQVLEQPPAPRWEPALLATAIRLVGDEQTRFLAATLLPKADAWSKKGYRALKASRQPELCHISEWGAAALLRSDWSRSSLQLAVQFPNRRVAGELSAGRRPLLSGAWETVVRIDDRAHALTSDWEIVCQFNDKESEYVEIQADLEGGWRIERQMLLARADGFVLLADAILGPQTAELQYEIAWPLANGVGFREEGHTHEGWLTVGGEPAALLLPLALPEWRTDRPLGQLRERDNNLVLSQQRRGRALFCPLFVDLKRKRIQQPYTWRQLSVGADRVVQPADVAVGYRVHIGKRQWLVYRALAERACRSVLGQHILHDFVVGRFTRDGMLDELVLVES